MSQGLLIAAALLLGSLAAWGIVIGALVGLRVTRPLPVGVMHYFFLALVLSNGLAVLVSTRNFELSAILVEQQQSSNPIAAWAIRLTSLLALVAAADQITRRISARVELGGERLLLVFALTLFWLCNVPVPMFFSAHTVPFELNWVYVPIVGVGLALLSPEAARQCVALSRNAIIIFCAVGLLLIAGKPALVLQSDYAQGYLGIPRFAGLAPHAITMGLIACIGIWCLLSQPFQSKVLQRLALAICLLALFLAQSKTVWISFLLTLPILLLSGKERISFNSLARSKYRGLVILGGIFGSLLLLVAACFLIFGNFDQGLNKLLASDEGSRIMSLTGRDRIWDVALAEWRNAPIFGYGLPLFGPEHQFQIKMSFATSGHNQLFDSLGRTGLVGTSSMVLYVGCLLYFGWKYRQASGGLSAVLVTTIVLRMVSEVPITMTLSIQSIGNLLLLVTIAMGLPPARVRAHGAAA